MFVLARTVTYAALFPQSRRSVHNSLHDPSPVWLNATLVTLPTLPRRGSTRGFLYSTSHYRELADTRRIR
jgi:hypothetical protein